MRYDICSDLISFCNELLIDLEYTVTPITSLIEKSLENYDNLGFISDENIVRQIEINSTLNTNENDAISAFFYSLGKSDVDSQLKQIKCFIEQIKVSQNKYLDEYQKYKKINLSFGFFLGSIICLILA